jgi:transposase
MAKKYQNKQEALRIRVNNFYNDHKSKGKMFTIYGVIQRAENNITAKRKHGSGRKAKKMNKRALNRLQKAIDHSDKLSQGQAARQFNITHSYVNQLCKEHQISARKKIELNNKKQPIELNAVTFTPGFHRS